MFGQFINALFLIFAAEMGDKTQILAMMFATRYKTSKVLLGIFIGSLLNHGLAVAFGTLLGQMIPIWLLQVVAGFAFIGFAFWTLMGDEEEDESSESSNDKVKRSAVIVVAMAFFLGELGDKTQLTAITLSVGSPYPHFVLMGTVAGMLVTSGLGIMVGSKIGDRLPEALIKVVSSAIFLTFGVVKLMSSTPPSYINLYTIAGFVVIVSIVLVVLLRSVITAHKEGKLTPYRVAARALYDHAHEVEKSMDAICRGVEHCGQCQGEACPVGFIRHLAKEIRHRDYDHDHTQMIKDIMYHKNKFNRRKLVHAFIMNNRYLITLNKGGEGFKEVDTMRQIIEILLFDTTLVYDGDLENYIKQIKENDPAIDVSRLVK